MAPFELIVTLLPALNAGEKSKLAAMIGNDAKPAPKPQLSPCQRNGHAYRITEKAGWFSGPVLTCTKCGRVRHSK